MRKEFVVSPVYWDFTESGARGKSRVKEIIEEKF